MIVEILSFGGCPNQGPARATVERLVRDLRIDAVLRVVDVPDARAAEQLRFLGSPTIRVDGEDVEPGAVDRTDFGLTCRVYRTDAGLAGQPDTQWIRVALLRAPRRRHSRPVGSSAR